MIDQDYTEEERREALECLGDIDLLAGATFEDEDVVESVMDTLRGLGLEEPLTQQGFPSWGEEIKREIVPVTDPATPLEELLGTVGLINVKKRYVSHSREVIPHDFRWTANVSDLMFQGELVVQLVFPPAKIDLVPQTMLQNLAVREHGYSVVTGQGTHLFMGAIAGNAHMMATVMIVTPTKTEYFTLSRRTITPSQGPIAAWCMGCPPFFHVSSNVQWQDKLADGDNIIMIDGDMWYYPRVRDPTVYVRAGRIVDRNGRDLTQAQVQMPDGMYAYNIDTHQCTPCPVRPPSSQEIFTAWRKIVPLPAFMSAGRRTRAKFEVDPTPYSPGDRTALIRNPQLRSMTMMKRADKYREQVKMAFLTSVSRNIYLFPAYEAMIGRLWQMMECANGISALEGEYLEIQFSVEKPEGWPYPKRLLCGAEKAKYIIRHIEEHAGAFVIESARILGCVGHVNVAEAEWTDVLRTTSRSPTTMASVRQKAWWKVRTPYREISIGEAASIVLR